MTDPIDALPRERDSKKQFTIRATLIATSCLCVYLALAKQYGFGRAVVCSVALLQAVASVLFFATSYWSWRDEQVRNAWAAFILGLMVLAGSVLFGSIVFQSPSRPASAFEGFDLSGDASTLETENESVR